jgi:hypothetical protein
MVNKNTQLTGAQYMSELASALQNEYARKGTSAKIDEYNRTTTAKQIPATTPITAGGIDLFQDPESDNIIKIILGTGGDVVTGVGKGIFNFAEGIADTIGYGIYGARRLFGETEADLAGYKRDIAASTTDKIFGGADEYLDQYSALGRTSRGFTEGVGQLIPLIASGQVLGSLGSTLLLGGSSLGSGMSEAYMGGATDGEALAYGAISATTEVLTEKLFGGLGKGFNAAGFNKGVLPLDDMTAKAVSKLFKSQTGKNVAEYVVKMGFEGLEEAIAGYVSAHAKKGTFKSEEDFAKILEDENLFEQFLIGAMVSGVAQAGDVRTANKTGTDLVTGLTRNEQAVVDKEVENRITQEQKSGKKLSGKEKSAIYEQVVKDMERGYISTETIESVLGKDALSEYDTLSKEAEEFKTLYETEGGKLSEKQKDRLAELKEKNKANPYENLLKSQREKISQDVSAMAQNDRLGESYAEQARKGEKFQADVSKYSEAQRKTVQNAIDSGILNNTNRSHEFVDLIAKISADKGISFDFADNAKLKEYGFALDGVLVNGFVNENGVTINIQSAKALNRVVGYEITHVLEGTELYNALQSAVTEYAKGKKEYDSRLKELTELYKSKNANVEQELVADLVGDYLFTDADFIKHLSTEHRNLAQKIYDEIKYLCKVVTAGTKEARQLEKVKKAFADAYRAETKNPTADGGTKYSLNIKHTDGSVEVLADARNLTTEQAVSYLQQAKAGTLRRDTYIPVRKDTPAVLIDTLAQVNDHIDNLSMIMSVEKAQGAMAVENPGTKTKKHGDNVRKHGLTPEEIIEIISNLDNPSVVVYQTNRKDKNGNALPNSVAVFVEFKMNTSEGMAAVEFENPRKTDAIGYEYGETNYHTVVTVFEPDVERDGMPFDYVEELLDNPNNYELAIKRRQNTESATGEKHPNASNELPYSNSIRNPNGEVNTKFSLTNTDSAKAAENANQKYLDAVSRGDMQAAQQMVDEAANAAGYDSGLLYHGTQSFGFTEFDLEKMDDKQTIFLTSNERIASTYSGVIGKRDASGPNVRDVSELSLTDLIDELNSKQYDDGTDPDDKYQYSYMSLQDVNALIGSVNNQVDGLKTEIPKMIREYADRMATDFDSKDHRTHEQLVQLDKLLKSYDYKGISTQLYMLLHHTDAFNSTMESASRISKLEQDIRLMEKLRNRDNTDGVIIESWLNGYSLTPLDPQQARDKLAVKRKTGNYALYAKLGKTLDIDVNGGVWNDIRHWSRYIDISTDNTEVQRQGEMYKLIDKATGQEISDGEFAVNPYTSTMAANQRHAWMVDKAQSALHIIKENMNTTREIAAFAKKRGYDSVIFRNVKDNGGRNVNVDVDELADIYVVFDPNNVKSADPVTYDDKGEIIPITRRFDTSKTDIRYSLSKKDFSVAPPVGADVYGKDIGYDIAPPIPESVPRANKVRPKVGDPAYAPIAEEYVKQVQQGAAQAGKQRKWVTTSTESDAVNRQILPDELDATKITYEPVSNKKTLGNANAKLETIGYDGAVEYFNNQIYADKVSLDDIALGERLIQEAIKMGDTVNAGELIQNIAILGTELGQKVQALSIIQRLTPEGQLKMLQKIVNRGKAKGDNTFNGVEITQDMIDHILSVYGKDGSYDQNNLNRAVEEVKQQIADQMTVTKMEKINGWRYLSMLGNPKTHIRNILSNLANMGTIAVKDTVARTIESVIPADQRTKTWKPASNDVKDFAKKTTAEMKDQITGEGKYNDTSDIKAKRDTFNTKVLQRVYGFNSDLLSKEDWWFSKPAFKQSFQEFLTANGVETAQDIQNNPKLVEKAKKYALERAEIATFRQASWLASKLSSLEKKNAATQVIFGSVIPFKKTPINVAKAGLSYSPLGFAKTLTYDIVQVKKGNMAASELVDHLAQNITGTGLALVGYWLARIGFLNGAGEDDKEGTYDFYLGEQAYSVNIGENTYSLSWLSPTTMPLFVGANLYEQLVEGKEWNADVVLETLAQTLDPMSEMSFLSSLDDVLSSYKSGMEKFAGIGVSALSSYASQFVPTALSQTAATIDDTKRTTKVAANSGSKVIDEVVNQMMYKIPLLRQLLQPSTDIWGNEIKQSENVAVRALENFAAPWSRKENISSAVDEELKELYSEVGEDGILPGIPENTVTYKGKKYPMSAAEFTAYKETYGQTAYKQLEKLFQTATYRNAAPADQAELVSEVYKYASDVAKREYLAGRDVEYTNSTKDNGPIYKENTIKGAIENDMIPEEYDLYRTDYPQYTVSKAVGGYEAYKGYRKDLSNIKADKDQNGETIDGSRKQKVQAYINGLDAGYYEKLILWKREYPSDDTYNREIINYLNSRTDISQTEMKTILEELGFKISASGKITWD